MINMQQDIIHYDPTHNNMMHYDPKYSKNRIHYDMLSSEVVHQVIQVDAVCHDAPCFPMLFGHDTFSESIIIIVALQSLSSSHLI